MKKLLLIITGLISLFGNTYAGDVELDLSNYNLPFIIQAPDDVAAKEDFGRVYLSNEAGFQVEVVPETSTSLAKLKQEIEANTMNKLKKYIVSDATSILYETSSSFNPVEYHFNIVVTIDGLNYWITDTKGPLYTLEQAQKMFNAFKNARIAKAGPPVQIGIYLDDSEEKIDTLGCPTYQNMKLKIKLTKQIRNVKEQEVYYIMFIREDTIVDTGSNNFSDLNTKTSKENFIAIAESSGGYVTYNIFQDGTSNLTDAAYNKLKLEDINYRTNVAGKKQLYIFVKVFGVTKTASGYQTTRIGTSEYIPVVFIAKDPVKYKEKNPTYQDPCK